MLSDTDQMPSSTSSRPILSPARASLATSSAANRVENSTTNRALSFIRVVSFQGTVGLLGPQSSLTRSVTYEPGLTCNLWTRPYTERARHLVEHRARAPGWFETIVHRLEEQIDDDQDVSVVFDPERTGGSDVSLGGGGCRYGDLRDLRSGICWAQPRALGRRISRSISCGDNTGA